MNWRSPSSLYVTQVVPQDDEEEEEQDILSRYVQRVTQPESGPPPIAPVQPAQPNPLPPPDPVPLLDPGIGVTGPDFQRADDTPEIISTAPEPPTRTTPDLIPYRQLNPELRIGPSTPSTAEDYTTQLDRLRNAGIQEAQQQRGYTPSPAQQPQWLTNAQQGISTGVNWVDQNIVQPLQQQPDYYQAGGQWWNRNYTDPGGGFDDLRQQVMDSPAGQYFRQGIEDRSAAGEQIQQQPAYLAQLGLMGAAHGFQTGGVLGAGAGLLSGVGAGLAATTDVGQGLMTGAEAALDLPGRYLTTTPGDTLAQMATGNYRRANAQDGQGLSLTELVSPIGGALNQFWNPFMDNFLDPSGFATIADQYRQYREIRDKLNQLPDDAKAQMIPAMFGSGPDRAQQALDTILNKSATLHDLRRQADVALINGDNLKAARLGAQATALEQMTPREIMDQNMNPWAEVIWGVAVDPLDLVLPGLVSILGLTQGQKAARQADRLFNIDSAQAIRTIQKHVDDNPALAEAVAMGQGPGRKGNWATWLAERTPQSQAQIDTDWLWRAATGVLAPVQNKQDALLLLQTLATDPAQLVRGIGGLVGDEWQNLMDEAGTVRFGPALLGNEEVAQRLPILGIVADQIPTMRSLTGEGPLNLNELIAEFAGLAYDAARRNQGMTRLTDLPFGAAKVELRKLQDGANAVVEYLDESGEVLRRSLPTTTQEAQKIVNELTGQIGLLRKGAEVVGKGLVLSAQVQRAVLSDMYLGLRPVNWVRNATSATLMLAGTDIYNFMRHDDILSDLAAKLGGMQPTTRLDTAATGRELGEMTARSEVSGSAIAYISQLVGKVPGLGRVGQAGQDFMRAVYSIPYDLTEIKLPGGKAIGVGEQDLYARGFHKGFSRDFAATWERMVYEQLDPQLRSLNIPPEIKQTILDTVVTAGIQGGRSDIAQGVRKLLSGQTIKPAEFMRFLNIPQELLTLDGQRRIAQMISDGTIEQVDQVASEIRKIFDEERKPFARMLADAPPQPGIKLTETEVAEEAALIAESIAEAGRRIGQDPQAALEEGQRIAQAYVDARTSSIQRFVDELSGSLNNESSWNIAVDFWSEMYGELAQARKAVDNAARRAMDEGDWNIKWDANREVWGQYTQRFNEVSDKYRLLLQEAEQRPNQVYKQNGKSFWDNIARYINWDEQEFLRSRQIELGQATPEARAEWELVIGNQRAYVDNSIAELFEAFRRYPTMENFQVLTKAMEDGQVYGARVAAQLEGAREQLFNKVIKDHEYYRIRNDAWRTQWADATVANNMHHARAIVQNGVTFDLPTWFDDFMGGEFRLRELLPDGTARAERVDDGAVFGFGTPGDTTAMPKVPQNVLNEYYQAIGETDKVVDDVMEEVQQAAAQRPRAQLDLNETLDSMERVVTERRSERFWPETADVLRRQIERRSERFWPETAAELRTQREITGEAPPPGFYTGMDVSTTRPLPTDNDLRDMARAAGISTATDTGRPNNQWLLNVINKDLELTGRNRVQRLENLTERQREQAFDSLLSRAQRLGSRSEREIATILERQRRAVQENPPRRPGGPPYVQRRPGDRLLPGEVAEPEVPPDAPKPLVYYRGTTPGETRKISTGDERWDSYLFVADSEKSASPYGKQVDEIYIDPNARILREGTAEFRRIAGAWRDDESLFDYVTRAARQAEDAGYDGIHFERQSDVGTAIFNRNIIIEPEAPRTPDSPHGADDAPPSELPTAPYADAKITYGKSEGSRTTATGTGERISRIFIDGDESYEWRLVRNTDKQWELHRNSAPDRDISSFGREDGPYKNYADAKKKAQQYIHNYAPEPTPEAPTRNFMDDWREPAVDTPPPTGQPGTQTNMFAETNEDMPLFSGGTYGPREQGGFTPQDAQKQESLIDMRPRMGEDEPTYAPKTPQEAQEAYAPTVDTPEASIDDQIEIAQTERDRLYDLWWRGTGDWELSYDLDYLARRMDEVGGTTFTGIKDRQGRQLTETSQFRELGTAIFGDGGTGDDVLELVRDYAAAKAELRRLQQLRRQEGPGKFVRKSKKEIIHIAERDFLVDEETLQFLKDNQKKMKRREMISLIEASEGKDFNYYEFSVPNAADLLDLEAARNADLRNYKLNREAYNEFWSLFNAGKHAQKTDEVADVAVESLKTIDDAERRVLSNLPQMLRGRPNQLTNGQRLRALDAANNMGPQFDNAVARATDVGKRLADFAMLNFSDRRNFDTLLALVFPYHYFWSRMPSRAMQVALQKPVLVDAYYEAKRGISLENRQQGNLPIRMQGSLPVPGTDNMRIGVGTGLDYSLPGVMYFQPNPFVNPEEASNETERWVMQVESWTPGVMPAVQFLQDAQRGDVSKYQIGDYLPIGRMGGYGAMAMGATGINAPAFLRWGDEWDYGRIRREIAIYAVEEGIDVDTARYAQDIAYQIQDDLGPLPEQPEEAQAIFEEGVRRLGVDRGVALLGAFLIGMPIYEYKEGEQTIRDITDERRTLGFGPENIRGSQAAVDALDEETNDATKLLWGYDSLQEETEATPVPPNIAYRQPYTGEQRPGVQAAQDQLSAAKSAAWDEYNAARAQLFADNPYPEHIDNYYGDIKPQIDELKAQRDAALEQAEKDFPSGQRDTEPVDYQALVEEVRRTRETQPPTDPTRLSMVPGQIDYYRNENLDELNESAVANAIRMAEAELEQYRPEDVARPGDNATDAEWDAYTQSLEERDKWDQSINERAAEILQDPLMASAQVAGRPVNRSSIGEAQARLDAQDAQVRGLPAPVPPSSAFQRTGPTSPGMPPEPSQLPQTPAQGGLQRPPLPSEVTPDAIAEQRDRSSAEEQEYWETRQTVKAKWSAHWDAYKALGDDYDAKRRYMAENPDFEEHYLATVRDQDGNPVNAWWKDGKGGGGKGSGADSDGKPWGEYWDEYFDLPDSAAKAEYLRNNPEFAAYYAKNYSDGERWWENYGRGGSGYSRRYYGRGGGGGWSSGGYDKPSYIDRGTPQHYYNLMARPQEMRRDLQVWPDRFPQSWQPQNINYGWLGAGDRIAPDPRQQNRIWRAPRPW